MLSKSMVSREAVLQKSKTNRAIALAAISGCAHLGQSGRLWGELWEGLEELWESSGSFLYIFKLPINRKADVMLH